MMRALSPHMERFVNFNLPRYLVAGLLLGGIAMAHAAGPSIINAPTMVNTNLAEIPNPPGPLIFKDPDRPIPERVEDLLRRLTLEEKVAHLNTEPPNIPRLGITGCSFRNEGMHGLYHAERATVFPHCIAMAATWNPGLIQRVGSAIGDEARAKYRPDPTRRYFGVICWAPVVDLVRDPRWGRTQETYGEDPHLVSQCAGAWIRGVQGDDPNHLKVAATVKHFAVYGQETDRRATNLVVSARTLREYYLKPYEATLAPGGASSVMTAFTALNGTPCVANPFLLTKVLRQEWGFTGPAVSDVNAVINLKEHYKAVETLEEGVARSIAAGNDILGLSKGSIFTNALNAVKQGLLTETQLDQSVARGLSLRFRLGMFDPPDRQPWAQIPESAVGCSNHVALAEEVSRASLVLLKNEPPAHRTDPTPVLPLNRQKLDSIAVLGFYADQLQFGTVSPSPSAEPPVTVLAGIRNRAGNHIVVRTAPWFDLDARRTGKPTSPSLDASQKASVDAALKMAARSDVAIVVVGLSTKNEAEGKDRLDLDLPRDHQDFVEKVVAVNPATVVVLINGGCLAINWLQKNVPAIVEAWYPGEQGGHAIADVLFGDANPAGRLPITFYASTNQLLSLTDCEISRGHTYMYLKTPPLYPFGHGLSYTRFEYGKLRVDREKAGTNDLLRVRLEVKNVGARDGDEVVQCYVSAPGADFPVPLRQLRGFQRVPIPSRQAREVNLPIKVTDLASWSEERDGWVLRPGRYEIQVGASSADIRLRAAISLE
jgi:beta-glucosidase